MGEEVVAFAVRVALHQPNQPSGLDREAALALLEELRRLQRRDRRVVQLLDESRFLAAALAGDELGER